MPASTDDTLVTVGGDVPVDDARLELVQGQRIGRYVVLSKLGVGGMGIVYAAYDPELDRKVALKLLRHDVGGLGTEGSSRLLREAQALARLSHPNVVAIHDVGTRADEVWIAMEFVAGRTLGEWLAERPRGWREVLDATRPVLRGLAAAHDAQLIHRDVKPDNVMLGDDGRVRIMDFGLARGTAADDADPSIADASNPDVEHPLDARLTRLGAMMGTPAYMSPEQISGLPTDGRTDQFSSCVMLWEALYGERPFVGENLAELSWRILEGKRREPPRGIRIPGWLEAVLLRGLESDPEARWRSMHDMLEALEHGRRRASRLRILAASGGVALIAATAVGWQYLDESRRYSACDAEGATIDESWNDTVRASVRESFAAGASHGAVTADRLMPWVDERVEAWRDARIESCLDATVRDETDALLHERGRWCLDERRSELEALIEAFVDANAEVVARAIPAVTELRTVAPCRDAALMSRLPAPPSSDRAEARRIAAELSRAEALRLTGAYDEASSVATRALHDATDLGWPPVVAAAELSLGLSRMEAGDYDTAKTTLESAFFRAARAGAEEDAFMAAVGLVFTIGHHLKRTDEGRLWYRYSDLVLSSLPDPAHLRRAKALNALGNVALVRGDPGEAVEILEEVLALRQSALASEHPDVATALNNLANAHWQQGAYDEAARLHERALATRERAFGPEHPAVASSLSNLATAKFRMGAHDEAIELHERARTIRERVLGPDHPDLATTINNLANVHRAKGELELALQLHEQALAIRRSALGDDHADVAASLHNEGLLHAQLGEVDEAVARHEEALRIWEAALGSEHRLVAMSLEKLGDLNRRRGRNTHAAEHYRRARDVWQAVGGEANPAVAGPLLGLAAIARADGRAVEAVPLAREALRVRENAGADPVDVALARFVLARTVADTAGGRAEALELARQAREELRGAGDPPPPALAEVDAWLEAHEGEAPSADQATALPDGAQ